MPEKKTGRSADLGASKEFRRQLAKSEVEMTN
jgi:hypothetical protein